MRVEIVPSITGRLVVGAGGRELAVVPLAELLEEDADVAELHRGYKREAAQRRVDGQSIE
ncbi:hypothetical protein OHA21_49145 [Actinoplanes sp. NBC_00393]|uniref:hypothetical protein n=1 Tax=Actinoplanes sp. NBC_00393 TaxID=2975953 RepID=UPI002E21A6A3